VPKVGRSSSSRKVTKVTEKVTHKVQSQQVEKKKKSKKYIVKDLA
jgi:hypothetical protein